MTSPTVPVAATGRDRVAVIGAGVSGLTAAHLLARRHDVTLYEAQPRLGGHAHTHTVDTATGPVRVDSGFIVHNTSTYPLLRRLFAELGVRTQPTVMSMSVWSERDGTQYAGGQGIGGFVARPRQLLDRDYLAMLGSVRRFHRAARAFLDESDDLDRTTFGEFVTAGRFGAAFTDLYAVPLVSCVWSRGPQDALDYPARYLFRFLDHHGMLSVRGAPQWLTVSGGSAAYVDALAARLTDVRRDAAVETVLRTPDGVSVRDRWGRHERFDRVVVATHADEALALLGDPTPLEKEVLGAFRYSRNETLLHSDASLLPTAPRARAAWNYLVPAPGADSPGPVVTYWMNRLHDLPTPQPLLVTLNGADRVDPATVIASMTYDHPVHDLASVAAARRLPELTSARTAFAGAHHGWGFHEDGCRSGVEAARAFGVDW